MTKTNQSGWPWRRPDLLGGCLSTLGLESITLNVHLSTNALFPSAGQTAY